jgi:hypothetical protein
MNAALASFEHAQLLAVQMNTESLRNYPQIPTQSN